jgi:hypothetical protein
MSKPKTARRRGPTLAGLPKPAEQKPVFEPNLHARKRILDNLHDTIGSCEDLLAAHGEGCQCEACCLVANLIGSIRVFHMLLAIT